METPDNNNFRKSEYAGQGFKYNPKNVCVATFLGVFPKQVPFYIFADLFTYAFLFSINADFIIACRLINPNNWQRKANRG
ncbi:hypothetical protein Trydic_g16797 [Trypoxylus dichotomus]